MTDDLLARRNALFGAGAPLFYDEPITIVRGEGIYLIDDSGKRYVDMYNNVACVGHCHPHVVDAVSRQVGRLNVHSRYLHPDILDYAERLIGRHHAGIESVVFSCTGSEANEVALMMAKTVTGGRGLIATDAAYHGNTATVGELKRSKGQGDVRSIPFPDTYRLDIDGDPAEYYLEKLADEIAGFRRDGVPFAGMLICSICANEGLPNIPTGFLGRATELVHEAGGLMIADEVQAGLCRTGSWWGYDVSGFVPDIVTMGKPLGAGVPFAATAARRDMVEAFRRKTHYFNTFASSPLQAAAGNAVLDLLEDGAIAGSVCRVGESMRTRFRELQRDIAQLGDVRGHGLFVGLEWVTDGDSKQPDREGAARIVNLLKDRGFLMGNAGAYGNVLKIRPPLIFGQAEADAFIAAFESVVAIVA